VPYRCPDLGSLNNGACPNPHNQDSTVVIRSRFFEGCFHLLGRLSCACDVGMPSHLYQVLYDPSSLHSDQPVTDIGCGDAHNCALTGNGIVHSWGDNSAGMKMREGD